MDDIIEETLERSERKDIVITRVLDAPIERVWQAWTDCEQVKRWWGPQGITSPFCQIDFREGGRYTFAMRLPPELGGYDQYISGVYHKIAPLELIAFGQSISDQEGNPIDPTSVGMPPDMPKEVRTTVAFRSLGDRTEMTVTEYDWPLGELREQSEAGMSQIVDKLADALHEPKEREVG